MLRRVFGLFSRAKRETVPEPTTRLPQHGVPISSVRTGVEFQHSAIAPASAPVSEPKKPFISPELQQQKLKEDGFEILKSYADKALVSIEIFRFSSAARITEGQKLPPLLLEAVKTIRQDEDKLESMLLVDSTITTLRAAFREQTSYSLFTSGYPSFSLRNPLEDQFEALRKLEKAVIGMLAREREIQHQAFLASTVEILGKIVSSYDANHVELVRLQSAYCKLSESELPIAIERVAAIKDNIRRLSTQFYHYISLQLVSTLGFAYIKIAILQAGLEFIAHRKQAIMGELREKHASTGSTAVPGGIYTAYTTVSSASTAHVDSSRASTAWTSPGMW